MPYTPDITVYSPEGETRLLVEVKTVEEADEKWARRFRGNILAHFPEGKTPYFLLILPDRLYLWEPNSRPDAASDFTSSTQSALGPYFEKVGSEKLGGRALKFLVRSWLSDLVSFDRTEEESPSLEWLSDSGLYEAIRGGTVEQELAV